MKTTWEICDHTIALSEKLQTFIEAGATGYKIPATFICGAEKGKTIIVMAGVHSGEYPAVPATIRVANEIDPSKLAGRIAFIHCVNISGIRSKFPRYLPEDGSNLNANYPGNPCGSTGDRISAFFVSTLFPQADFILDLHSGGQSEPLSPCAFFPAGAGEKIRKISEDAARATNIPDLIASHSSTGAYSYAASKLGIPGILLERGYCEQCREEWIDAYRDDIYLLLHHFGLYAAKKSSDNRKKTVYEKTIYLAASQDGLWYPAIKEGQRIKKGDLLGHQESFFGEKLKEYHAESNGKVFYYSCALAEIKGNPLVAYGLDEYSHN